MWQNAGSSVQIWEIKIALAKNSTANFKVSSLEPSESLRVLFEKTKIKIHEVITFYAVWLLLIATSGRKQSDDKLYIQWFAWNSPLFFITLFAICHNQKIIYTEHWQLLLVLFAFRLGYYKVLWIKGCSCFVMWISNLVHMHISVCVNLPLNSVLFSSQEVTLDIICWCDVFLPI
jgi:hypothetical protein